MDYIACKIHAMEEETLGGGHKGGVEKNNQERETESYSIL